MKRPAVYILASQRNGTLYTGVTANITRRIWQHREDISAGFTKKYQIDRLVYFEFHADFLTAIARESAIKRWRRLWKIRLLEQFNPTWEDLYDTLIPGSVEMT
ncbi:MAG: GIY-YIG nuclease family protein [Chthoniobacterales bacterium]|nr:GIY-YIG nuclease family protein [Chthoniobacterales bacterium]